ncbi:unnamed protein product [Mytilus coruscus]|uniref:Mab-21-like HhH/H2TH-like domain-containing protein n=1 Tax=Mytilus coruscus TaxID=42192 RepID=A0A6J8ATB4_MYTCO|nr:unnamed protein product [Mytilus coruscus]
MNLKDKNISMQLHKYLCNIVGSEEVVRARREIFDVKDIVGSNIFVTFISSGSKAEGLDLQGSDYDQMMHINFVRVYESLNCVESDPYKTLLFMDTSDTKPGFTKLKLVNKSYFNVIDDWCETVGDETLISSKISREQGLPDGMIIHGPCQSTEYYDAANCLRCKEWITPAQHWIHRSRTAWPDYTLVTSAHYKLESVKSHGKVLSASELSCYSYLNTTTLSFISESIYSSIKRLVNRELSTYTLSVYAREVLQSFHLRNMLAINKLFYQQYKRSFCNFKMSFRSFSISSLLLLASLFYKCKRYEECLVMINYSLSRCSPNMIHLKFTNNVVEQTVFKEMKHRYGLLLAIKHLLIEHVYFRYPFCLLPDELIPLIVKKNLLIPPVVYSYLLQFLCFHHLADYKGKQNALHDLELTIRERYFILDNVTTSRLVHVSLDIVKTLL